MAVTLDVDNLLGRILNVGAPGGRLTHAVGYCREGLGGESVESGKV